MQLERLRTDYDFALSVFLGVIMICGVTPFAVLRFAQGEILAGVIDLFILLGVAANLIYAWRGGDIARAGLIGVLIATVGCTLVVIMLGRSALFWVYPVLLANYLLADRPKASWMSGLMTLVIAVHGEPFEDLRETAAFVATASVVSLFAYVFAQRTDTQRQQLQRLAAHDPLTGASNRLTMGAELDIAIERSRRDDTPVGLAVLDLDHFKRVNDACGHDAGDRVLVEFVQILTARLRRSDRLFRYGGEEFVLLLPGADSTSLAPLLEQLRGTIESRLRGGGHTVTASIGAALWLPGELHEQWLARADAAMYQAKRNGRNCVVVAPS